MVVERKIDLYQGDHYGRRLEFFQTDGTTPLDVSAWVFKGEVRRRPGEEPVLASFSFDVSQAAAGVVKFSLSAEQTSLLNRNATYDIQVNRDGGIITTLVFGVVDITREVTTGV